MNGFNLERVFFHELGHYTAHRTNQLFLGGQGVKALRLFPCGGVNNEGEVELVKPEGYVEGAGIELSHCLSIWPAFAMDAFFRHTILISILVRRLMRRHLIH